MRSLGALAAVIILTLLAVPVLAGQDKVTLCHAAGLDGTTKYVTLTVGYPAAYGEAGHFYENGTPRAGHEDDYLGYCEGDEPSASPSSTSSPSASTGPTPGPTTGPSEGPLPTPTSEATPEASLTPQPTSSPSSPLPSPIEQPELTLPPTDTED